jgi:tol-pal system protein YbgF
MTPQAGPMNAALAHPPRPKLAYALGAIAVALAALASPQMARAALFEDEDARRAIIELRAKINDQARQIEALKSQIADLNNRLEQRIEPAMRGQIDSQNQMENLRQELAKLRGAIEVQTNELANTQRRQRDQYADIDARVKKFEPTQVQVDGRNVAVDPAEKRAYDNALAQFRAGEFRPALSAFQQFTASYPDSAYLPSAMYWEGSAQFALKDNKSAIATHQAFLAKFPDHPRAPDAMLNLGYAQIESGDRRGARKTLEGVSEKYPGSPAAQAAKDRLASLK